MYGSVTVTALGLRVLRVREESAASAGAAMATASGEAGNAQPRPAPGEALHWVLQVPVFGSAGVNRLFAEELNSSCPAGTGRLIQ